MSQDSSPTPAPQESLIDFPAPFPIKAMGENSAAFLEAVKAIAARHDPQFDAATIELRQSAQGKYLGITITVLATSREHLDGIYRELTAHPLSKMVL
ncbi:DUF493 domain-containing protein [Vandammella animalimorsus]|uniref:UPF0250 protein CK623_10435 n=1 Tax=Vandammella animalimorsus TaxID=2029117 RepID=A0A2A2ANK2_9BURK|nr:DUF493 domain-containing protein [Vandammella animalimorsus]PAT39396.1 DUF493 domain-containing protein [Vandammella animalimorsus]